MLDGTGWRLCASFKILRNITPKVGKKMLLDRWIMAKIALFIIHILHLYLRFLMVKEHFAESPSK